MKAAARIHKKKVVMAILKTLEGYKSTLDLHFRQKSGAAMARLCTSEDMHTGKNH